MAQMPFAKQAGPIMISLEHIGHRRFVRRKVIPHVQRPANADSVGNLADHQRRAGRRTKGIHVKISQPHGFREKMVKMGRLQDRIAVTAQVAVPLIVGHQENNIRPFSNGRVGP